MTLALEKFLLLQCSIKLGDSNLQQSLTTKLQFDDEAATGGARFPQFMIHEHLGNQNQWRPLLPRSFGKRSAHSFGSTQKETRCKDQEAPC